MIAGQGTIGLELAEQLPKVETVVIPIGGGGLASGIALALRATRPEVKLVGVQADACAPFAGKTEHGFTIAEGIAVKEPGELTSAILGDLLDGVVTVTDEEISQAIVLLLERTKLVVEGAGAASVAALLAGRVEGKGSAVAILSGGNIDPTLLIQVMRHGLTLAGRYLVVRTRIGDRPGELIKLLSLFAEEHANVVSVEHHREGMNVPVTETEVEATLLTRDQEHCAAILDSDALSRLRGRKPELAVVHSADARVSHLRPRERRRRSVLLRLRSVARASGRTRGAKSRHRALRRPRGVHEPGGADGPGGRAGPRRAVLRARARSSSSATAARSKSSSATRSWRSSAHRWRMKTTPSALCARL